MPYIKLSPFDQADLRVFIDEISGTGIDSISVEHGTGYTYVQVRDERYAVRETPDEVVALVEGAYVSITPPPFEDVCRTVRLDALKEDPEAYGQ